MQSFASAERVFELLEKEPSIQDPVSPRSIPSPKGDLRLDNVSFSYPGRAKMVLKSISLTLGSFYKPYH